METQDEVSLDLTYQVYKVALEKFGRSVSDLQNEEHDEVYRIAQRKLRIEEAVLRSGEAANVCVPESQVEDTLLRLVNNYEDRSELYKDLEEIGLTEKGLKRMLGRELHVESVMDYVAVQTDEVSDEDVSLFYYMNAGKFKQPEIRTARHILVTINEDSEENTRENAFQKITSIQNRIQRKPARFEEQALKHSECPTSLEGGLLGQVRRGVLYPELEEILFEMQVGEHSQVVESPLGFHILRCDEIESEGQVPLERIEGKLREQLIERKRKHAQRDWLNNLLKTQSEIIHKERGRANV